MAWTKQETEVAAVVVDDLRARGWTVYQEVTVTCAGVVDIVATKGRVLWAIEAKISLGLPVLAQARTWLDSANLVSVAVPPWPHTKVSSMAVATARAFGIGVLQTLPPDERWDNAHGGPLRSRVREVERPERRRKTYDFIRKALLDQQQTFAPAGNADGKRYTPFAATCDALRETLRLHGPMTVGEAIKALGGRHHYANEASAKGSIYKWAERDLIDGVELLREGPGRHARLRLR